MRLNNVCAAQLAEHLGMPPRVAPTLDTEEAQNFLAAAARTNAELDAAGFGEATTDFLYAVLPTLLRNMAPTVDVPDRGARLMIREFLADWDLSDQPFYLLTIGLKTLERRLFQQVAPIEPSLDLGIGDGHASNFIFRPHRLTVGSDPVLSEMLAAKPYACHERLMCIDATAIPFADETFASVFMVHSIDHVEDRDVVLGEIARVLKPGGVVAFSDALPAIGDTYAVRGMLRELGLAERGEQAYAYWLDQGGESDGFDWTADRYTARFHDAGFVDVASRDFMSPTLTRFCYAHYGLGHALGRWHSPRLRADERLREFFFDTVTELLAPLIDADDVLCNDGGGTNLFVTATKAGELDRQPSDVGGALRCPACGGPLSEAGRGLLRRRAPQIDCAGCGRKYPIVDGLPLLMPVYADEYARIAADH